MLCLSKKKKKKDAILFTSIQEWLKEQKHRTADLP